MAYDEGLAQRIREALDERSDVAEKKMFGGLVASGCHVFCIRSWLSSRLDPRPALVAGLGLEAMDLPTPVRPGDRLSLRVEVLDKRRSSSRPDRGIVRMRNTLVNQRGEPVMTLVAKLLVSCRAAG